MPVILILAIAGASAVLETFAGVGTKLVGLLSQKEKAS
ncbi:hypothetical protein J2S00_001866 [Caldalkalibacillus uzonensis]|uniref:QacE family quaternary ammonium compound efflux SMR transporter n=1 Tax=Caldalkalibacillus uzonensis TaxID=353224 RepID=A0ABU0CRQ4_9BACI|nr:hypothetical protein [Caldalkalibacillus uzonensis]